MKQQELRKMIRRLITESEGLHRCVDGSLVSSDSPACLEDLGLRIDDAVYHRDTCSHGSATRSHYNGMLADLRKKERRLKKNIYINEISAGGPHRTGAKDTRRNVADARIKGVRDKNLKDILFGEEEPTEHNPRSSMTDMRRLIKTIWNQHADIASLSDSLNIVHWFGWQNHEERNMETLKSFASKAPPGSRSNNEISVMGYTGTPRYHGFNCFGVLLSKESRITIASNNDLWTEEMNSATEETLEYYRNSGVPKRPNPGVAPKGLIYSPEDIKGDTVHELVVDNWVWDTIVIGNDRRFSEELKGNVKEWCGANGVRFLEFGDI